MLLELVLLEELCDVEFCIRAASELYACCADDKLPDCNAEASCAKRLKGLFCELPDVEDSTVGRLALTEAMPDTDILDLASLRACAARFPA